MGEGHNQFDEDAQPLGCAFLLPSGRAFVSKARAMIQRVGEAIVLRSWPFLEADLLVSLFTREQGRIKGVARHALRSRKRFGGALEPMTYVRASYAERPRQELVRLDAFEILSSPLSQPVDYARTASLQLVAEVLEEALPEQASDDAVFRLALSVMEQIQVGAGLAAGDLLLFMDEPPDGVDAGARELRGVWGAAARGAGWYSATADGVTCYDDRRNGSVGAVGGGGGVCVPDLSWAGEGSSRRRSGRGGGCRICGGLRLRHWNGIWNIGWRVPGLLNRV